MRLHATTAALITALVAPAAVWAQADPAKVDTLFETMALPDMLEIMQAEGIDYGDQIATDLFPGRPKVIRTTHAERTP